LQCAREQKGECAISSVILQDFLLSPGGRGSGLPCPRTSLFRDRTRYAGVCAGRSAQGEKTQTPAYRLSDTPDEIPPQTLKCSKNARNLCGPPKVAVAPTAATPPATRVPLMLSRPHTRALRHTLRDLTHPSTTTGNLYRLRWAAGCCGSGRALRRYAGVCIGSS
jgi:hypothetical protein